MNWTIASALATLATASACGSRPVEVRGQARTDVPLSIGPITYFVVDEQLRDSDPEDALLARVPGGGDDGLGPFRTWVWPEGDMLEVFALRDDDRDGVCGPGDGTAITRVAVPEEGEVVELDERFDIGDESPCPVYASR